MSKSYYIFIIAILFFFSQCITQTNINIKPQKYILGAGQCKNTTTSCRRPQIVTDYNYNGVIRSGYLSISSKSGSSLGFIFYGREGAKQQQLKNYPIIISLGGGPGLSSQVSNLREIGPFVITDDLWIAIKNNTYSWTKQVNLLFIDQPLGTGFSCLNKDTDIPSTMTEVVKDLYQAINQLFSQDPAGDGCFNSKQLRIPPSIPLYIFGEGYGGKFAAAIGAKILMQKKNGGIITGLKGVGIGAGLNAPMKIMQELGNFAYSMSLLDYQERIRVQKILLQASIQYSQRNWKILTSLFEKAINYISQRTGVNTYDITLDGGVNEGILKIDEFFSNKTNVERYAFELDNGFQSMAKVVYNKFESDFMLDEISSVEYLLGEGVSILVYQGQNDGYVNTAGTIKWVQQLNYKSSSQFRSARLNGWKINGKMMGSKKAAGNLTMFILNNAGHYVPQDSPEGALYMLRNWLYTTKLQQIYN